MFTRTIQKYSLLAEKKLHEYSEYYWEQKKEKAQCMIDYHKAKSQAAEVVTEKLALDVTIVDEPLKLEMTDD